MIIRKHPREMMFMQNNGGKSGVGRRKRADSKTSEPSVHGVLQSEIDAKKGAQAHQPTHSITWKDVQAQYAKVGIPVTDAYAQDVHGSVQSFTGAGYSYMRSAMIAYRKGDPLSPSEQEWLRKYRLCEEWCKVAPLFVSSTSSEIYRGIGIYGNIAVHEYAQKIKSMKPGEIFDLDRMPSSFSTNIATAKTFAQAKGGIIVHMPTSSLKNASSIKGLSLNSGENEVLVGDYGSRITKIDDQVAQGDGYYHVYIE